MTEHIQQVKRFRDDGVATETTRTVTDDGMTQTSSSANTAARIVWLIAGIIIALLAIRFVFILFGANQGNGFVDFIYNVSHPFAAPFFGIFGYSVRYGISRFEVASLVAIVIYGLIAWGLARLLTIRHPQQ